MSEQGTPLEGTPAVAGPEGTPGTAEQAPQIDWQDRYQHLQPEYTRATQENAELRQRQELYDLMLSTDDADIRREAAQALGYELAEDETQDYDDADNPFAAYDERIARLEQSTQARDQEAADAEYAVQVRQIVDQQLNDLEGLDKDDQDWVLAYAINALPITEEGLPDIQQAYEVFNARETARQRAWAQTKRAPHIAPNGQSATEVPNLDNRQERQDWIARRLMEGEQAQ